jgi:hypothetical protein
MSLKVELLEDPALFTNGCKGAIFGYNRKYRYSLIRIWNNELPKIMFIGLNPSTANETHNDPTIRRVINFAKEWDFGGIYMCNLFAVVSTDPKILNTELNPIGDNDMFLQHYAKDSELILFAWGNFKEAKERAEVIIKLFPGAYCLGKNINGTPKHPLYVRGNVKPIKF